MLELRYAVRANEDFRGIFRYGVEQWGGAAALAYLASFDTTLDLIARHPRIGRERRSLGPSLRSITHRSHVLIYRVRRDHVLIVRVLHGAMDIRAQFTGKMPRSSSLR